MKLDTALEVARQGRGQGRASTLVLYRARNGHYLPGRLGHFYLADRPTWTFEEFLSEFEEAPR